MFARPHRRHLCYQSLKNSIKTVEHNEFRSFLVSPMTHLHIRKMPPKYKILKLWISGIVLILMSGCTSISKDVSRSSAYNNHTGQTAHLNTELDRKENENSVGHTRGSSYVISKWDNDRSVDLNEWSSWQEPLEKGAEIKVLSFNSGGAQNHVLMDVYSPRNGRLR